MDEKTELLLLGLLFFSGTLATLFLADATGYLELNIIKLDGIGAFLSTFLAMPYIAFAFAFPFVFALASALSHYKSKEIVFFASIGGSLPAILLGLVLFGSGFQRIVLSIFYLVAVAALVETSFLKKDELKHFVTYRVASQSAKTAFTIIAIGIFVTSAAVALQNNESNVKQLGDKVMDLTLNQKTAGTDIAGMSADMLINSQKQSIDMIMQSQQYQNLTGKQDPDVQAFVVAMDSLRQNVGSAQAREKIIAEIKSRQGKASQPITFEFLRKQSPLIAAIADYYWLLSAFAVTAIFTFFSNVVARNLAGFYATIIRGAIMFAGKEKPLA